MQVTIDSKESLEEVLSVLSTMFDTRIVGDPTGAATAAVTSAKTVKPVEAATKARALKRPVGPTGKTAVDASAVRAWAREQGTAVTDRGALPKKLIAAYQAAQA